MFDRFSWTRDKIEELTRDKPGSQIVDIGCNECPITKEMANCIWVDCQSYEAIAEAMRKKPALILSRDATGGFSTSWRPEGAEPIPTKKFVQADAQSLPFEDKRFDVAVATQLLAYPENPVAVLREMKRIARHSIITVRNEKDWNPRYRTPRPANMRFYTEEMLKEHLREAGMDYTLERLDYNGWSFFAVVTGVGSRVRARFIGGIGACGGTLLVRWLGSHPDVYSIWETGFIPSDPLYNLTPDSLEQARNLTQLEKDGEYLPEGRAILDRCFSELGPELSANPRGTRRKVGNFIDRVLSQLAGVNSNSIWVEKTPMNIFFGDRLMEYFGDAFRIVWVEREPRDNICCIAFGKEWGPNDLFGAIDYWNINTKMALKSVSAMPKELYMRVNYEDFVYNQVGAGRKICDFLQIPWHESLEVPITTAGDIGRYRREFRL